MQCQEPSGGHCRTSVTRQNSLVDKVKVVCGFRYDSIGSIKG